MSSQRVAVLRYFGTADAAGLRRLRQLDGRVRPGAQRRCIIGGAILLVGGAMDESLHAVQDPVEAERVAQLPLYLSSLGWIVVCTRIDGSAEGREPLPVDKLAEQCAVGGD